MAAVMHKIVLTGAWNPSQPSVGTAVTEVDAAGDPTSPQATGTYNSRIFGNVQTIWILTDNASSVWAVGSHIKETTAGVTIGTISSVAVVAGWPDEGVNEVVKTIGSGPGRDHSTIDLWEQATDDNCVTGFGASVYVLPCSPVGECYDDEDFAERPYLYEATTDANHYRRLSVAVDQRHNGTHLGSGVTVVYGNRAFLRDKFVVLEWLILNANNDTYNVESIGASGGKHMIRNCIMLGSGIGYGAANNGSGEGHFWNCIIIGFTSRALYYPTSCKNLTILTTGLYGIQGGDAQNCVVCGATSSCFVVATGDYNISSDHTAPGGHETTSFHGHAASELFKDVGTGTEDLHLLSNAPHAIGGGTDLSTSFTDDIDGETRPTGAGTWDIGADQYSAGAPPAEGGGVAAMAAFLFRQHRR